MQFPGSKFPVASLSYNAAVLCLAVPSSVSGCLYPVHAPGTGSNDVGTSDSVIGQSGGPENDKCGVVSKQAWKLGTHRRSIQLPTGRPC